MIAQGSPKDYLRIVRSQSGREDSNLRPSAPKALNNAYGNAMSINNDKIVTGIEKISFQNKQ